MDSTDKKILQSNLITTSTYNHTGLQENILSYIAYSMSTDIDGDFIVNVSVRDLEKMTDKKLSYSKIKVLADKLTSIKYSIKWKDVKGTEFQNIFRNTGSLSDDDYVILNCIIEAQYIGSNGSLSLVVNKSMIPFFSNLKEQFTIYNFSTYMKLKSFYSKRFFTMFSMFRSTGIYKKRVEDLKEIFGLGDSYPNYKDFRRRIITPSIKEINELTPFEVSVEEVKQGRKVETLIFKFSEKPKVIESDTSVPLEPAPVKEAPMAKVSADLDAKLTRLNLRLKEIGVDQKTIDIAFKRLIKNPKWKVWPEVNKTKMAIRDGKEFPNKHTLKKFILEEE